MTKNIEGLLFNEVLPLTLVCVPFEGYRIYPFTNANRQHHIIIHIHLLFRLVHFCLLHGRPRHTFITFPLCAIAKLMENLGYFAMPNFQNSLRIEISEIFEYIFF